MLITLTHGPCLQPVLMELGGKSPLIVFDDVNLDTGDSVTIKSYKADCFLQSVRDE